MADGVPITAGSGTTVATDDAGAAGHVQVVKLAIGTDGSATVIPADATNGLDVDVTRLPALPAGTNNIGDVDVLTLPKGSTAFTDPAPSTSATLVLAANSSRKSASITNAGTVTVYLGPSGVTTTSGVPLVEGATFVDDASTSAWYGIVASGTGDVRVCEVS